MLPKKLLISLCESNTPMINAGVISFSNRFFKSKGWEYRVYSVIYSSQGFVLVIDIKNKIDTLVEENDTEDDCVVCTNPTNQTVKCCNQPICLKCLKEIKRRCDKENTAFCCPMCRRDLDNSATNYKFDKEFLRKLTDAGENEQLKIDIVKEAIS